MPDQLFFHFKSACVYPGTGVHEQVADKGLYKPLMSRPRWRSALSNFWVSPFTYTDGRRYNSVEHCFQAQKLYIPYSPNRSAGWLRPFEETIAYTLCLNSHSELSRAEGADAQRQRKAVVLTKLELQFWDSIKEEVMATAQFAKFSQSGELRQLLLDTGTAELWHGAPRQPRERMMSLERVRAALRAGLTELPTGVDALDEDSEGEA
jgi:predicted NAD-dependent protein-ADP-ribosyltransferase YbiA (DUF1768 family)